MAARRDNSDDYATKGDLKLAIDDLRASINRDLRHALDEALGRQSADSNQRMDQKFATVDERFDKIEGDLAEIKAALQELTRA